MPLYFVTLFFLLTFKKFQADIVDVNTIFKDLATMVHEQGEMVDSIEANVESAQMRVEEGTTQLGLASTYQVCRYLSIIFIKICFVFLQLSIVSLFQSKLRRRKCILAIIIAIVLAIVIGIIIWQSR
jgi:t-SNARE complex subunit (syntaxin)